MSVYIFLAFGMLVWKIMLCCYSSTVPRDRKVLILLLGRSHAGREGRNDLEKIEEGPMQLADCRDRFFTLQGRLFRIVDLAGWD